MTNTEFIQQSRAICDAATDGPWFPGFTDDDSFMNCRFVSTVKRPDHHDDMQLGDREPESVVAVTLLQSPYLASVDECDQNMVFISHSRTALPDALARLEVAEARVKELESLLHIERLNMNSVCQPF